MITWKMIEDMMNDLRPAENPADVFEVTRFGAVKVDHFLTKEDLSYLQASVENETME